MCVSSNSKNGRVLEYRRPQLGQSVLVTKPLAAGYLLDAMAQPDVGRQHAVDQGAGRLAHSLAVSDGRPADYRTATVRNSVKTWGEQRIKKKNEILTLG